jgi:hypothetical protein
MFEDSDPSFQLDAYSNGVNNLDAYLTINSQTVAATFRYIGGSANASGWGPDGYGEMLNAVGSDGLFNQGSPFLGTNDDSVNPNRARYWQAGNTSFADIITEDFVVECIIKWDSTSGNRIFGKYAATDGWLLYNASSSSPQILIGNGSTSIGPLGAALIDGAWYHIIGFMDRSGSGQIYVNGVASGSPTNITSIPDSSSSIAFNAATSANNSSYIWKYNNYKLSCCSIYS